MKTTIFSIRPGAPFLKTFVAAFLEGGVVEGFSADAGPLALAEATIYAPTRRAARALTDEFARARPGGATLTPRILPLGALEDVETGLIFETAGREAENPLILPLAIGEIDRRMRLSELILKWSRTLTNAIVRIEPDGAPVCDASEPLLVGATPADAFALSGELARLIDELIIEDVPWRRLDPLAEGFDAYWRVTLGFLDIAIASWPAILAERNLVDAARRQISLIGAEAERLKDGAGRGPVVAIGSTGSNRATARLLEAIAGAPQGAVVLPGLDLDLDDETFALIAGANGEEPAFTHPQAALARLLRLLNVPRAQVRELGRPEAPLAARAAFVSQALRPAETTDAWIAWRKGIDGAALDDALADVVLIEAADEREEALALALAMRETLERPGETAALITPDRELARRVAGELMRWDVSVDDSGGEPLGASQAGLMARVAAACAAERMSPASLAALVAHESLRVGLPARERAHLRPLLEICVLRGRAGTLALNPRAAVAAAQTEAAEPHAHPLKRGPGARDWDGLLDFLSRLRAALEPLLALDGEHELSRWIDAHRAALDALTDPADEEDGWGEDDDALADLFDELAAGSSAAMSFSAEVYLHFFAAVVGEARLRRAGSTHPRLKILGLIEARLIEADVMLLGGLDEATWPPQPRADAFLNRPMRAELRLSPPERRLGQTAHDFTQAMGARRVILSRAAKRGGSPTVASRFLQRLAAVGDTRWAACAARGAAFLDLAAMIDRPEGPQPALRRPAPKPPVALRPRQLSVTRIETLRRDPYAIYAETILRLTPLDPIGKVAGSAQTGAAIHAALEQFARTYGAGALPPQARGVLSVLLRDHLQEQCADPDFCAFEAPRLERMIDFYLDFEQARRQGLDALLVEVPVALAIPLDDGSIFTLTARADRVEHMGEGAMALIDFKTGRMPGMSEVEVGFAPQMTLETAMALRGAFGPAPRRIEALYVKLNGAGGGRVAPLKFEAGTLEEVAESHFQNLVELLAQFRDPDASYPPRPFPRFAKVHNVYDHLARVQEWSAGAMEDA